MGNKLIPMFRKYLFIIFFFVSCTDNNETYALKQKISQQQATIDSLTKSKGNINVETSVDTSLEKKSSTQNNKQLTEKSSSDEDLSEDAWIPPGEHRKCPIKILNTSIRHNEDFSAIGILELQNNYSKSTSALELDFGASKKRFFCKIPAKSTITYKLKLSEDESNNFITFYKDGENLGLHFDKVIFSDGHMWEGTTHGY